MIFHKFACVTSAIFKEVGEFLRLSVDESAKRK